MATITAIAQMSLRNILAQNLNYYDLLNKLFMEEGKCKKLLILLAQVNPSIQAVVAWSHSALLRQRYAQ